MRVLSFIPALLFAASSFVAAAPATAPSTPATSVPACGPDTTTPSNPGLQAVVTVITDAQTEIQAYVAELTTATQASPADATTIDAIVVKISVAISDATTKFQSATQGVTVTSADYGVLAEVVYGVVILLSTVLSTLVPYLRMLVTGAVGVVGQDIGKLAVNIHVFLGALQTFVGVTLGVTFVSLAQLLAIIIATVAGILGISLP